ncbi:hypothetical protein AAG570_012274 [Ranatra chinensis]|uniref:Uncharacterized protein n=1 Tax=Ranatra chinensis TaxID=642074 RepID=A0ABD0YUP3_9HEMI
MYNRLKIELIVGKYTAVKYIDLSDISDSGIKGYLPTYGPSYLHFYKFSHHFVGSLLVSLSAQTFGAYQEGEKLRCVKKNTCEPLPKVINIYLHIIVQRISH